MKGLERAPKGRKKNLAATYSPARLQYHRREGVSLPCSGWERVSPSVFGMGTGVSALLWPPGSHPEAYRYASDDPFGIGTIIWPSLSDH